MKIEELRKKRRLLSESSSATLKNMEKIRNESVRVAEVAKNSSVIIQRLNEEFESQTGLNKIDVAVTYAHIYNRLSEKRQNQSNNRRC